MGSEVGQVSHIDLFNVLVQRFSLDELEVLLWLRLDKLELETVTPRGPKAKVVKEIVSYAERRELIPKLVAAVRDARPDDKRIAPLAQQELETPFPAGVAELEQLLHAYNPILDPLPWFAEAQRVAGRVCSIQMPLSETHKIAGTGVLVGKNLVLTAYHVIRPAVAKVVNPKDVRFHFDYIRGKDDRVVQPGVAYGLANEWLMAWQPESAVDEQPEPKTALPAQDELDFAVVRLDDDAGDHSAGAKSDTPPIPKRGWVRLPTTAVKYLKDSPLNIYHHPLAWSLKLSIEMRSIVGMNGNGTRLRHRTNTLNASSGSPCFDAEWNLIALHHAKQTAAETPYNQAVPIGPIAAELKRLGVKTGAA